VDAQTRSAPNCVAWDARSGYLAWGCVDGSLQVLACSSGSGVRCARNCKLTEHMHVRQLTRRLPHRCSTQARSVSCLLKAAGGSAARAGLAGAPQARQRAQARMNPRHQARSSLAQARAHADAGACSLSALADTGPGRPGPSSVLTCAADARPWSLSAHAGAVTCLAWHAGSGALTSGDAAGQVLAWAPGSGGWAKQLTHHQ